MKITTGGHAIKGGNLFEIKGLSRTFAPFSRKSFLVAVCVTTAALSIFVGTPFMKFVRQYASVRRNEIKCIGSCIYEGGSNLKENLSRLTKLCISLQFILDCTESPYEI